MTINDFIKKYNELFKTTINMISIGSSLVYADFLGDENNDKLFSEILPNKKYVITINCDDENIILPDIMLEM